MRPRHHRLADRLETLRTAAERGATLVEYALVASLLLVGSLAVIDELTTAADAEISNQADCVETRPPPPECQLAPIPPSKPTTTTIVSPTSTSPPYFPEPFMDSDATVTNEVTGGTWRYYREIYVGADDTSEMIPVEVPLEGIYVQARVRLRDPVTNQLAEPGFFVECWTGPDGFCPGGLGLDVPVQDVDELEMAITRIDLPEGMDALPDIPGPFDPTKP